MLFIQSSSVTPRVQVGWKMTASLLQSGNGAYMQIGKIFDVNSSD